MDWETGLKRGPFSDGQVKQLVGLMPELDIGQVQWLSGYLTGISPFLRGVEPLVGVKETLAAGLSESKPEPVWILYGTHTGNCEQLAKESAQKISALGMGTKVLDMGTFKSRELKNITKLLVIVSTDGEGDPPVQAEDLLEYLHSGKCPELRHISYSVLALGDTSYTQFCETGKDFDTVLEQLGAKRIAGRIDCDVDFEDDYARWIDDVVANLGQLSVGDDGVLIDRSVALPPGLPHTVVYDRKNPFPATVLAKINLNGRPSARETLHLELDLKDSHLQYEPGDALGIYAVNAPKTIEPLLKLLQFSGEEIVETYLGPKRLSDALASDYELTPLTGVSLNRYAAMTGSERLKKIAEDHASVAQYIYGRDIFDLLNEEPYRPTPAEFISLLRKNTPRMYSLASSRHIVEDEAHILVSVIRYEAFGRCKEGHCSSFLSDRIGTGDELRVFVDRNSRFKLPADDGRPIIMVGAGTGVAPFRAFMQHREAAGQAGKSWLFFGERNFTTDFLYQTEWLQYIKEGILTRADVAFSRDQDKKIYVQHKMIEQGKQLFGWLEEGAHFYVCGDKNGMARDVDFTLRKIVEVHGDMTEDKAAEYVKSLQLGDRYQTDVY